LLFAVIPWSSLLLGTNEHPKNLIPFVLLPSSEKAVNKRIMQMSFNMVRTGILSTVLCQWCTIYPIRLNPRPPSLVSERSRGHIPPFPRLRSGTVPRLSPGVRAKSRTHPPFPRLPVSERSRGHIPRYLDSRCPSVVEDTSLRYPRFPRLRSGTVLSAPFPDVRA